MKWERAGGIVESMETTNSRLLDQAFSMKETFIIAVARHHAIINLAQEHLLNSSHTVSEAWDQCVTAHCDGMSETEAERCCLGEQKAWMKDAKRQVAAVMKANLPWTIRSADTFFLTKK